MIQFSQYIQYLVFVGPLFLFIGIFSYLKETLQGKNKPNKVTWLLWAAAAIIPTIAAVSDGVNWKVAFPIFISGVGCLLIFFSSFINKKSYWKLEKFDYLCGAFALLAIILWIITKEPVVAIILSIVADFFAAVPTLKKVWLYPETETVTFFIAGAFNALTSFAAITSWTFSAWALPTWVTLLNLLFVCLILRHKIFH